MPADSQDRRRRRWLSRLLWLVGILCTLFVVLLVLLFFNGRTIEEQLTDPHRVVRWTETELLLDNGAAVRLPGVGRLASAPILTTLLSRGVEVRPDGRVIGLAKIWHWCGNDPVRRHIARVDVANALLYFGHRARAPRDAFSEYGWNVSDFLHFRSFEFVLQELPDDEAARVLGLDAGATIEATHRPPDVVEEQVPPSICDLVLTGTDEKACETGDWNTCQVIGDRLVQGEVGSGANKDPRRAAHYYELACDGGIPRACVQLGWLLESKPGRRLELFRAACEAGCAEGCEALGFAYSNDPGIRPAPAKAQAAYRRACSLDPSLCD